MVGLWLSWVTGSEVRVAPGAEAVMDGMAVRVTERG